MSDTNHSPLARALAGTHEQRKRMPKQIGERAKMHPAYVAGIVDGEGYVGITRHASRSGRKGYRYCTQVSVASTDRDVLIELQRFSGSGQVREKTMYHTNRKQGYEWQVWGQQARQFILLIRRYLFLKAGQAKLVVEYAKRFGRRRGRYGLTQSEQDAQTSLYWQCRTLNRRGL